MVVFGLPSLDSVQAKLLEFSRNLRPEILDFNSDGSEGCYFMGRLES